MIPALVSRHMRRIGLAALLALAAVAAVAFAYFSSAGTGQASAAIGTLGSPTITAATAGAGTVSLSWSPVTAPSGSGGVTYYVSRDGGTPAGTCPAASSPSAATSCTDTGLSAGTHTFTVTAVWLSWTATSGTRTATLASGTLAKLVFTTQPDGSATGGVALPQQPSVTAEDSAGNTVTSYAGTVTLSIKSGTSGATLSGCNRSLSSGVTTFSGCKIDKNGTYVLTASDGTLSVDSAAFTVAVGPASQLIFTTQPDGSATGGVVFPQQPAVTAEDAGGNPVASYAKTITLTIKTGTAGATLSGCAGSLNAGVTTFSGCKIDKSGTYVLTADDGTLSVDSAAFTVSSGPVTQLVVTTQPDGSATGGIAFPQQPVITARDAGGNTATGYAKIITLSIKNGTTGAALSGCNGTLNAGVTTFSGCKIDKSGTYVLTASDGNLSVDTASFSVAVGAAAQLIFTTQPDGSATAGAPFPTQPVLKVQDAGGNTVTTDNSTVTLTIASGTPSAGGPGTLSGCAQTESQGVISFTGCTINTAGNGYKLHAADGSLPAVDSAAFNVTTTPPTVAVTYPTANATYGTNWTGTITGTASANGGLTVTSTAVAVADTTTGKWWNGTGFSASSQTYVAATGTTSWTYSLASSNLTPGHTYTVTGQATDSLGNVGTSSTVTFSYSAASVSVIGQAATKTSTITGVKTTNGASDLIVIYCWGGSSCGSSGSTPTITGPFSSVSTQTIQSIVFNGNTKSCVEVVQAIGNGQTGTVSVSFAGGSADSIAFIDVLELSPGATVKTVGTNPATQTQSASALATLTTTAGLSEIAIVGLDGNSGNDSITAPSGMAGVTAAAGAAVPTGGFKNPQSDPTVGVAGGTLGLYFASTAQASSTFGLSPNQVDWGTVALGVG